MGKYTSMRKVYYILQAKREAVQKELDARLASESVIKTGFMIGEREAFIAYCDEMIQLIVGIYKTCRTCDNLVRRVPRFVFRELIRHELIEEIQQTNELENVRSTRKEIRESWEAVSAGKTDARFAGMLQKYELLLKDEAVTLATCSDVRALYDSFILDEVLREDPDNAPDGVCFRAGPVNIYDAHDRCIHQGLFPEKAVMDAMERALAFLNNDGYERLIRIAAFHYMFGYIHPFYDGNGRMTRFISAYALEEAGVPVLISLRLSYAIKDKRREYYRLFKEANDPRNFGDLTEFVVGLLGMIYSAGEDVCDYLREKAEKLEQYRQSLDKMNLKPDERNLLFILVQAALADSDGIDTKELALACKTSERTLRELLKKLEPYWVKQKDGRKNVYRANLDSIHTIE